MRIRNPAFNQYLKYFLPLLFRKLNHQEVVEEDRRNKEPKNMEARKRRAEYILQEEEQKAACLAEGKDWEIEKLRWGEMLSLTRRSGSPVLRIRYIQPEAKIRIFSNPGSRICVKNLSILTPKIISKLSEI
jgi:hypothetical protein